MGLIALSGGGIPPFAVDGTSTGNGNSTVPPAPLGIEAVDSSGGKYVLGRGVSGLAVGQWVILNSSVGYGQPALASTAAQTSSGSAVGIAMAANTSTSNYSWYQVYGPGVALGDSTTGAAGAHLWQSTTVVGTVHGSSGGQAILGMQTVSSNASSLWNVWLTYPHLAAAV